MHLKKQLTGSPRVLIESLPLNDLTYESAKKMLRVVHTLEFPATEKYLS